MKLLGEVPPLKDTAVTHGICEQCHKKMMEEIEEIKKENR
jgi:hypothetical protein